MGKNLSIAALRKQFYQKPADLRPFYERLYQKIAASDDAIWIYRLSKEEIFSYVEELASVPVDSLPLWGIPFAIKDNIDLAGVPTTAACPDFSYQATESATVVQRLIDAGAIPVGKTNLDQFATGLVGVRSPYGTPANALNQDYIPGGSSSGSAVAVALGLCAFSLGTDTAGSGRVPAAFNGITGLKPTKGLLSTCGVVPACRTLDVVSIFANDVEQAQAVLSVAKGYDVDDPYSIDEDTLFIEKPASLRIGIPQRKDLAFFGNEEYETAFREYVAALSAQPDIEVMEVDFSDFLEAARLLYEGPWLAERFVAIEEIITSRPEVLHPITRAIIEKGDSAKATDAFKAEYRLATLKRKAYQLLQMVDVMLTPTTGTHFTKEEVEADPLGSNSKLGYYTNFMNLLDLSALAFPVASLSKNLSFGVTIFGERLADDFLVDVARSIQNMDTKTVSVIVCGAHRKGLPLNHQLVDLGATFVAELQSAPVYRFYALDTVPPKPGLIKVDKGGVSVLVEEWKMPLENLGTFLSLIPAPLGLGKVSLADGREEIGFIAEAAVPAYAKDISELGDWKKFLEGL